MSTYMAERYAHSREKARLLEAERRERERRKTEAANRARPLDTRTIDQWPPEEWAEFERRFAPPSWRRSR